MPVGRVVNGVLVVAVLPAAEPMTLDKLEMQRGMMTKTVYDRKFAAITAAGV